MKINKKKQQELVEFLIKNPSYYTDKKNWGEGEWQTEPDIYQFRYKGYWCVALRHPTNGNYCGYVLIKKGSKWDNDYNPLDIDCHGGLTYSGKVYFSYGLPNPEMITDLDSFNCIGFDCNHGGDFAPGMVASRKFMDQMFDYDDDELNYELKLLRHYEKDDIYRNLQYVKRQLEMIVDQIVGEQ